MNIAFPLYMPMLTCFPILHMALAYWIALVLVLSLMQKTKKPFLVKALVTHPKAPIKGWICDQTNSSFLSIGHNTILAKAPA